MDRPFFKRSALSVIVAAAGTVLFHAPSSFAQVVLEEVIVSAQKRLQKTQEVPISVSNLNGERFDTIFSSGDDIRALGTRVPGLYAESSNGRAAPRFYIRGLGNVDFDLAASQPVSIVMDDVIQENVTLKSFPLFDVESVEVIRGPQGTLFGRNTTAGIVKLDTRKPTEETEGFVKTSYSSYETFNVEGAVGGTLIDDTLMGRVSVLSQSREDWIDNGFTEVDDALGGYDEKAARVQLLYRPNEQFSALFNYHHRDLEGTASVFRANVFTTGSNELNRNFDRDTVYFDDGDNNPQHYQGDGSSLKMTWALSDFTITSITAIETANGESKGDIDGGNIAGPGLIAFPAVTEDKADVEQYTQEIRIASPEGGDVFWQVGAFAFDSNLAVTTVDGFFGETRVTHENQAWALFGQVAYDITDQLTLTGGLRYTDDRKELFVDEQNLNSFALQIGVASIQEYAPVEQEDDQVSWELSANYRLTDTSNTYARIARGFRAQSIQGRNIAFEGDPSVADSETINSFEVGYKTNLLDDRLRLNAGIFYYEIDDIQLSAIGGASNGNNLLNAEKGIGQGFDIEVEYLASEHLMLTAGYNYSDTELDDDGLSVAVCGDPNDPALRQCTVKDPTNADGNVAFIDGNPFQGVPESTFNFTLRYSIPLTDSGELFMFTDWAYQGETSLMLYEAEEFVTDEQFEGGLRIGYTDFDLDYEIALFGRNITDEENVKGVIDFNNLTGFVNEPRTIGAEFRMNF
ncbi:TonB-dependent receptor [Marinibactrum halimedae]|uniref:TonB-dependent receptor n=1 Tax=Marinibactrum halimedae TaxID=1444977 RepID=A0AA37T396_9GAMM|nr:TonB-dependent receptor [Marinibactrum halimedae]MCD9460303.1 TonB-dependent receptor [Marinibactrum halimedae]GLS24392.1 TonB-dependent receptor [Marinibactrum halimedae]